MKSTNDKNCTLSEKIYPDFFTEMFQNLNLANLVSPHLKLHNRIAIAKKVKTALFKIRQKKLKSPIAPVIF